MNQSEKVLDYIKTHGSIDAWRAQTDLHILRLASRIFDLRKAGFDITGIIRTKRTEDGYVHWMEYTMKEPFPTAIENGSEERGKWYDPLPSEDNTNI